jgi:hypothetical protein
MIVTNNKKQENKMKKISMSNRQGFIGMSRKLIVLLVCVSYISLTSCEIFRQDDREKFVGTWMGTKTTTIYLYPDLGFTSDSESTMTISLNPAKSDGILVSFGGSMVLKATVTGDSFEYEKESIPTEVEGGTDIMEISGKAIFTDKATIEESVDLDFDLHGTGRYPGKWTCTYTTH